MHAALESLEGDAASRTPAEVTAPWPIDLVHLRRYTMGDQQLEREVLDLFAGELPKTVAALRSAATEPDWKMASHTLKGSARAVGAWRLARAATIAERNPDATADEAHRSVMLEAIEAAVSETVAYIRGLKTNA